MEFSILCHWLTSHTEVYWLSASYCLHCYSNSFCWEEIKLARRFQFERSVVRGDEKWRMFGWPWIKVNGNADKYHLDILTRSYEFESWWFDIFSNFSFLLNSYPSPSSLLSPPLRITSSHLHDANDNIVFFCILCLVLWTQNVPFDNNQFMEAISVNFIVTFECILLKPWSQGD